MAYADDTILGAVVTKLGADVTLTALLGEGSDSIILAGRARATRTTPFVTVETSAVGSPRQAPFFTEIVVVRAYDGATGGDDAADLTRINPIIKRCIEVLNGASIGANDVGIFDSGWAGRTTKHHYDESIRKWYRSTSFYVYATLLSDVHV